MARNKKKSKAAAHAACESDEEREDENDAVPQETTAEPPAPQPSGDHNSGNEAGGSGSDSDDEDSDDAPKKKKKEYKGNRLTKKDQKGKKGKGKGGAAAEAADSAAAKEAAAASAAAAEEAAAQDTRAKPIEVLYCPNCSFPAEYCEFGGMMDKCRPWLLEHAAELADAEDRGRKRRILTEKDRLAALMEGRGIKKALERIVLIDVEKRTGKRMITSVFGMDLFGFNMKDLSREWRKRFSCGVGVRAAEEGKHQDCIDVQGNVVDDLAQMLVTKYEIPKASVYTMEGKKKVPYPY